MMHKVTIQKARPIINQLENTQSIPTDQTASEMQFLKIITGTGNPPTTSAPPQDSEIRFPDLLRLGSVNMSGSEMGHYTTSSMGGCSNRFMGLD